MTKKPCLNRREFLFAGACVISHLASVPGFSKEVELLQAKRKPLYLRRLKGLKIGRPQTFEYPEGSGIDNVLVRLGTQAGLGVGPDSDIVAFTTVCPHMGSSLMGTFKARHNSLGPCPYHLSSYDLARFGQVISGQATETLAQVTLEIIDGEIYATGFTRLVYGYTDMERMMQSGEDE